MNRLKKIVRTIAFVFCSFARSVVNGGWIQKNENPDLSLDKSAQWGTKSVAYTQNDGTNTYYTSIESALKSTSSGTVYVIPGTNPTISHNCEIKSGVTLALPYEDDLKEKHVLEDSARTGTGDFADKKPDTYRKSQVTIADKITLTNNGTLFVGGVLGRNGQAPTGRTIGNYSEITLGQGAHITNSGELTCYGYIKEKTAKNGSSVDSINSGKLNLPFVIYDFRGGAYSAYAVLIDAELFGGKRKACPFNVFDFPNIQGLVSLSDSSSIKGIVTAYASDAVQQTSAIIVGPSSLKPLICIESGTISYRYDAPYGYAYNDILASDAKQVNKTTFYVSGEVSIASMSVTLGITMDTSKFCLPFSYKFDFEFISGRTTVSNRIKFLAGSRVHIQQGATLQVNNETTFYQNYVPKITYPGTLLYPSYASSSTLINDGKLVLNADFGGIIEANQTSGIITTESGFSSSTKNTEALTNKDYENHTETAKITLVDTQKYVSGSDTEREYVAPSSLNSSVLEKNKTYTSGKRSDNGYGWHSGSVKHIYGIRYVSNSSTATNPSDNPTSFNDGDSNDIVINDRSNQEAGKIFGGYYYDSELTKPLDKNNDKKCVLKAGTAVNYLNGLNHITLYAKWTDKLFDVTLEYRKEGGVVGTKSFSVASADTSFVLTNPSDRETKYLENVNSDAKVSKEFNGWKISGDENIYQEGTDVLERLTELHNKGTDLTITEVFKNSKHYLRLQIENGTFSHNKDTWNIIKEAKINNKGSDIKDDSECYVSVDDDIYFKIEGSSKYSSKKTRLITILVSGFGNQTFTFSPTVLGKDEEKTLDLSIYKTAFESFSGPIIIKASAS